MTIFPFENKKVPDDSISLALLGNPNVGKSSVFNQLTGLHQHTGNWPGKTVDIATGYFLHNGVSYALTDLPGTYSLMAHSPEEEIARDFILFNNPDAVVIVCDATCLERNMNLVLQTLEIIDKVVLCVNLLDEAKRHGVTVDLENLSQKLGVPVIGTVARKGRGLVDLKDRLSNLVKSDVTPLTPKYTRPLEDALEILTPVISRKVSGIKPRFVALRLLEGKNDFIHSISGFCGFDLLCDTEISETLAKAKQSLSDNGISQEKLRDLVASCLVISAEGIVLDVVSTKKSVSASIEQNADKVLTSRIFGIPVMLALLCLVFWITVFGANIPSQMLSQMFARLESILLGLAISAKIPEGIYSPLIFGVYHILTSVISVMLPPMAIFFPLFTILEDSGYLPRIAFNLDKCFKKCSACGKQALTMCMGFGCNAVGVTGTRIIDSPRERLIAILTNCFVPCNGKFPTLISLITMFMIFSEGFSGTVLSAIILTATILAGIFATFLMSKFLSKTLLKGEPSSFVLELPPYRKPDFLRVIIRSILDRTLFVLGRAAIVAAPAGLVIWLFANVTISGASLLSHASVFLEPFATLMGLDGVILLAFILGFPANETVLPIIIMAYMQNGTISDSISLNEMKELFLANGWTTLTAINTILFSLFHWPCSTTLLTVKKETGSIKWTFFALLIPTVFGIVVCMITKGLSILF